MVLKNAFVAAVCTAFLAMGSVASADEYRPGEFFGLDLSKAVLSPKRLGPPTQFQPVPVEANSDHGTDTQAKVDEPKIEPQRTVRTTRATAPAEGPAIERSRAERSRKIAHVPARARLARRHSNPLDAQARDTRIQTWPCRSGGICKWR
ncbi:hypothetical protein JQ615_08540 [Bradyrhizobium jicamae]|uniref:Uncharacterized protein n=1 Tax=Bradyrhizobium jicamae TaxID=280332 RepID=A0ABS5FF81_9BRAD|nr:hypothetical protein [Bradyrhizobium jicamae]MBR0795435.1 hypothetical protein [Bradyrhizobium jicamae]